MTTPTETGLARRWLLAALLFLLPVLVLAGFGLWLVIRDQYWLPLAIAVAAVTLLLLPLWWWLEHQDKRQRAPNGSRLDGVVPLVEPPADWGQREQQAYEALKAEIDERLATAGEWEDLQEHGWQLVASAARLYGKSEWGFSVPELLRMSEEVSRRYRRLLLANVPGIEHLSCAVIRGGVVNRDRFGQAGKVGGWLWNTWRLARVTTPAGWLSELRGQLLAKVLGDVNERLQLRLKQALLLDVAAVAIDLYSGRFRFADEELPTATLPAVASAIAPEPVRVVVLGQTSAGKSSLVNALLGDVVAETSPLPATRDVLAYEWALDGTGVMQLVDLPGLTQEAQRQQQLLEEVTHAHILVWVLRANQPAREADVAFRKQLDDWYACPQNQARKRPQLIVVLNQVDRLFARGQWQAAVGAEQTSHPQIQRIQEAMDYNRELLEPDVILPLVTAAGAEHWNLEALEIQLDQGFREGINTQLNQRRLAAGNASLGEQLGRVVSGTRSLFRLLKKPDV